MRAAAHNLLKPIRRRNSGTPALSDETTSRIRTVQVQRALDHLPMIYAVALFNISLIMVLCFHLGLPLASYGWMAVVALLSLARMIMWIGRSRSPKTIENPEPILRNLTIVSVGMISGLSAWSVYALTTDVFGEMLMIPVSLVFGSTCIAHCLAPIRRAAIGVLIVGVVPAALYMLVWGGFDRAILGASMLSITLLMIVFLLESYQRIVDGIVMEEKIRTLAHTDALTGIANRRALMEALDEADEDERGEGYAIAMLDLNRFKQINDTLGHHVGDALLQSVARRLRGEALPSEQVGRLGGDEFLVMMAGVRDPATASARVTAFLAALSKPVEIDGHRIAVSGGMGYALSGRDGDNAGRVMKVADEALYAAKRAEKDNSGAQSKDVVPRPVRNAA